MSKIQITHAVIAALISAVGALQVAQIPNPQIAGYVGLGCGVALAFLFSLQTNFVQGIVNKPPAVPTSTPPTPPTS